VWSPDGQRIVFSASRQKANSANQNDFDLYVRPASGQGAEELLLAAPGGESAHSWSPDGQFIAYVNDIALFGDATPVVDTDIWVLPLSGERKPSRFLPTPFLESQPRISPDGRWMAFVSNESGRNEIYVASFPSPSTKVPISAASGTQPRWRGDGREIFYMGSGGRLMAVSVQGLGARFDVGESRDLFTIRPRGLVGSPYDVTPDGERFLVNELVDVPEQPVTLVVNWLAGLKK
jgi:Tol biopolymer transport system component